MPKIIELLRLKEKGLNLSQVAASCNCSRDTVKSYWDSATAVGLSISELSELSEEEVRRRLNIKRAGRSRKQELGADYWLEASRNLSKKGMTLYLLWEEYKANNASGMSYSNYCLRYRQWSASQKITYRQSHKGGERLFVDFSGMTVSLTGGSVAQIFVGVLGASNLTYVEATPNQGIESWIGAHVRMLSYIGGVPEIIVPDNLRSGVTDANYYEPGINRSYQDFAQHYCVAVIPTRVRKPQDKAKVEEAVQNVQRRILARLKDTYQNVAEVNEAIRPLLEELNNRTQQVYGVSRWRLFEEVDKPVLKALPTESYQIARWAIAKVNIDFHVEVEKHYYSVPYTLVRKTVDIKIQEKSIEIFHNHKRVATHLRLISPGRHTTLKEHMPEHIQKATNQSPREFLCWAESIGKETYRFIQALLLSKANIIQGYRASMGIKSLEKHYGKERLENACKRANFFGLTEMKNVKTILASAQDRLPLTPDEPLRGNELHENIRGDSYYH